MPGGMGRDPSDWLGAKRLDGHCLRVIVCGRTLMSMKRPMPVTSCTECSNAGYNPTLINLRCGKTIKGERCTGTNSSAINDSDWKECPSCNALEPNVMQLAVGAGER